MGNRAFIVAKGASVGVSLQWNGGRDSVEAFLKYTELAGIPPMNRMLVGLPGFVTVVTNFFGNSGKSVYLESCNSARPQDNDPGDNGVYVTDGYNIVERYGCHGEQRAHNLEEMLKAIDSAQPERDRLGALLDATEVPTDSLTVGAQVLLPRRYDEEESLGRFRPYTVLGYGEGMVNGTDVTGTPYVDMFEGQSNARNINSFIHTNTVHVVAS